MNNSVLHGQWEHPWLVLQSLDRGSGRKEDEGYDGSSLY